MDFLADDVAPHKKQSIVSSTHGTSQPNLKPFDKKASIQTEFNKFEHIDGSVSSSSKVAISQSNNLQKKPLEESKLQNLIDFSKKVGLNHRVI